jgi:WD40 repeat protein
MGSVAFAPDGKQLAGAGWDVSSKSSTVQIWDTATGQALCCLKGDDSSLCGIAYDPLGHLISASNTGTVKVWDICSRQARVFSQSTSPDATCLACSPKGAYVVTGARDGTVTIWDVPTGRQSLQFKHNPGYICGVAISSDDNRVATAYADHSVAIWDAKSGRLIASKQYPDVMRSVAFSPDGGLVASASEDGTVRVMSTATNEDLFTLKGHQYEVRAVAFSPDGQHLATSSLDRTVKIWHAHRGPSPFRLRGHTASLGRVIFSPNGNILASSSSDRTMKVWDVNTGQLLFAPLANWKEIRTVTYNADGRRLAAAYSDGTVTFYDAISGREKSTVNLHSSEIPRAAAFSPNCLMLAAAGQRRGKNGEALPWQINLWDAETGRLIRALAGHKGEVSGLAFSPDGALLASVSEATDDHGRSAPGEVFLWEVASGCLRRAFKTHTRDQVCVAFSPDSRLLASGSRGGFDPKGKLLPGQATLWNVETGQQLWSFKGHNGVVIALAFSPDGKRLASGSEDKTVKIWDLASGQEILALKESGGMVLSVAFSPDGKRLAAGLQDHSIVIWDTTRRTSERCAQQARNATIQDQALALVQQLFSQFLSRKDITALIRSNSKVSMPVQELSLVLAAQYWENPEPLNNEAWAIVCHSGAAPQEYLEALRKARRACEFTAGSGIVLNTLGVAQYRAGQYEEALRTLIESDKLNADPIKGSLPEDLAFLAMAHYQLGHTKEARSRLRRLQETMKRSDLNDRAQAQRFLEEARMLINPRASSPNP